MDAINEIVNFYRFNLGYKMAKIKSIDCESYVFDIGNEIGVAIPYSKGNDIFEKFNMITLKTMYFTNSESKYLTLSKPNDDYIDEFAHICYDFIKGDIQYRQNLLDDPMDWVLKWKQLLGNKNIENNVYDILAELLIYKYMLNFDSSTVWYGCEYGTHDISSDKLDCEVKSTRSKYGTNITISSKYQLKSGKNPVNLYFVRVEKSKAGISVNQAIELFEPKIINIIEESFHKWGYNRSNHVFNEKYKILEIKEFKVDDKFPVFNLDLLNDNEFKKYLLKVEYTLSLDGLDYKSISIDDIVK